MPLPLLVVLQGCSPARAFTNRALRSGVVRVEGVGCSAYSALSAAPAADCLGANRGSRNRKSMEETLRRKFYWTQSKAAPTSAAPTCFWGATQDQKEAGGRWRAC
eukprot:1160872-Pelagomonas_calceolata.AAC.1